MCHMLLLQVGVNISSKQGDLVLRASSSEVSFAGYMAVYTASHFRSAASTESEEEEDGEGAIRTEPLLSTLQVSKFAYNGIAVRQAMRHGRKPARKTTQKVPNVVIFSWVKQNNA